MEIVKVIITAMQEEAEIIIKKYNLLEINKKINLIIYEWKRVWDEWEEKIVLILSWIWKIQATIATTYALENYLVDKIINIWIAWNIYWDDIKIWDVFIPNTFIQHDIYLPFNWEHLNYAKKPIFLNYAIWKSYDLNRFWLILSWVCITWDQFIDNDEKISELKNKYWADICDMEAFAILSVAREYNILDKCVVIKSVSDWANNDAIKDHMTNLDFAMNNSIDVLDIVL